MTSSMDIPGLARPGFEALSDEQKAKSVAGYNLRRRNAFLMLVLALVFPIQLFFLGKIGLGILFLITGGGFGVWYVVEWFLTPGRVRAYNTVIAMEVLASVE